MRKEPTPDDVSSKLQNLLEKSAPSLRRVLIQHYAEIEKLRQAGVTWVEISAIFNRAPSTVFKGWQSLQEAIAAGKIVLPGTEPAAAPPPAKPAHAQPADAPREMTIGEIMRQRRAAGGITPPNPDGYDELRKLGIDPKDHGVS